MDIEASVIALATGLGLDVDEPVHLRSTHNLVLKLRPSAVVAKVSTSHDTPPRGPSPTSSPLPVPRSFPPLTASARRCTGWVS